MNGISNLIKSHIGNSQNLWRDLSTLCTFGGRFAGSESERKAREFLLQRLAAAIRAPVKIHEVRYAGWSRVSCDLKRLTP